MTDQPLSDAQSRVESRARSRAGRKRRLARAASVAIGLGVPAIALAQEAASPAQGVAGATVLDPISVESDTEYATGPVKGFVAQRSATATKTDTPILETPQSVTVVTRDQIDVQRAESVSQALRYTAGVVPEVRPTGNRYDSVILRGFGGQGTGAAYVNYLDNMRLLRGISFGIPTIDPYALERIEVLRGPSSVLFGQINPGGMVNLVSKRPTTTPFREIELQTGSYGRKQAAFDLSGPIDPDGHFLYRIVGLARDADTQVSHTKEQRMMLAPSFTWRPDTDTTVTLYANLQRDPEAGFYGALPINGTLLPNRNGRITTKFFPGEPRLEGFSRDQAIAGYSIEHKLTDQITLRQNLRYIDLKTKFETVPIAALSAADQRTVTRRATVSLEHLSGVTMDNQAQFNFDTGPLRHTALVGLDYLYGDAKRFLGSGGTVPTLNLFAPVYGRTPFSLPALAVLDQKQTQLGLYAQDQIKFDRFVLTAGVRQDWADVKQVTRLTRATTNQDDTATTGRVGLTYLFDSGVAPFVSYSTSFEPALGASFAGTPFKPTTGEQYEAGVKFQPVGYNAFIQASVYDLTQNNVLTADTTPGRTGYSVQTGQIKSQGIEIEGRASLNENLDIILAYSNATSEVTRANDVSLGHRPVNVPVQTASAWANYTFREGWLSGFGFGGGIRYVGNTLATPSGLYKVPDYALVDAVASYDFGALRSDLKGLKASLNAQNLFDKQYVSGCFSETAGCVYGLRRTLYATLTYRW